MDKQISHKTITVRAPLKKYPLKITIVNLCNFELLLDNNVGLFLLANYGYV
jgi:hypothetical protein